MEAKRRKQKCVAGILKVSKHIFLIAFGMKDISGIVLVCCWRDDKTGDKKAELIKKSIYSVLAVKVRWSSCDVDLAFCSSSVRVVEQQHQGVCFLSGGVGSVKALLICFYRTVQELTEDLFYNNREIDT